MPTKKPPITFAARLKAARAKAGLSQAALAIKSGVNCRTLQQYEQGTREPTIAPAKKLADACGCSLDELAG